VNQHATYLGQRLFLSKVIIYTHWAVIANALGSRVGTVSTGVCVFVCLSARYLKNRCI